MFLILRYFKQDNIGFILWLFKRMCYARIAQLVEHDLAKVGVAGSSPVSRSQERNGYKCNREVFFPDRID